MWLSNYISKTGFTSNREAKRLITEGKVTINGNVAILNSTIKEGDEVRITGKLIELKTDYVYLAFNKPAGITCTTEPGIKDNITAYMNYPERIFTIGRLDKDSEGLILLTNDGDIVNKILRSENKHQKEYLVTLTKPIANRFIIAELSSGVDIGGVVTQACTVEQLDPITLRIILTQGLNRQIRRMMAALGYQVKRLQRVRIMNIRLEELVIGKWRNLTPDELNILFGNLNNPV